MKINQKLLERLSSSNINTDSFFKKIEDNKNKKVDPEQFIGSSSTNFRVRNLNQNDEMDQSMLRKSNKFDAMSTATTNFYKHQEETEQTPVIQQKPIIGKHRILNQKEMQKINISQNQQPQMSQSFVLKKSDTKFKQQLMMKPPITLIKKEQLLANIPPQKNQLVQLNQTNFDQKPKRSLVIPRGTSQEKQKEPIKQKINIRGSTPKATDLSNNNSSVMHFRKRVASAREKYEENIQQPTYDQMNEETLEEITGKSESQFQDIKKIVFRFNCSNDSLDLLGHFLPNLLEIRLNNSHISSLRELGTHLRNLKILWISYSHLKDISGINAFPNLSELYCCFNSIKDLSPIAFHDNITEQILDLDSNEIQQESQIEYLETLDKLEVLNLNGNPLMKDQDIKSKMYKKLPRVEFLNEENEDYENNLNIDDDIEPSDHLQKLYDLAAEMNITDIEEFKQLEMQVSSDWNNKLLDEPDDYELLTYSIKTQEKQKARPKTGMQKQKTALENDLFYNPDPQSQLAGGGQSFQGNPLKAAREKNKQGQPQQSSDIISMMKQVKK